jgi:hypothetical protein
MMDGSLMRIYRSSMAILEEEAQEFYYSPRSSNSESGVKSWLFLRGDLCCLVKLRIFREFSGDSCLSRDSGKMSGISGTFESNG